MNLRRKLVVTFGALGFMTLLIAAVTAWAVVEWGATESKLKGHYERSLLLQNVRAQTFQATLEVAEGLSGDDPDARQDFDEVIVPAQGEFERWAALADTEGERQELVQVRAAFNAVVHSSYQAFDLLEAGRMAEAQKIFDEQLEDNYVETFQAVTQEAEKSDQERRETILQTTHDDRQKVEIMLAITAFAALGVVLLLAAYLVSDLFGPLTDLRNALRRVQQGDRRTRLTEERSDEIGDVNKEFNRMVAAVSARERETDHQHILHRPLQPEDDQHPPRQEAWMEQPARVTLHRMISDLHVEIDRLGSNGDMGTGAVFRRLSDLSQGVSRLASFSYPLDLQLERTDMRGVVHDALRPFQDELTRRGVGMEIDLSPEAGYAAADRLKLRESIKELIRNALQALPEHGGRMGLRVSLIGDGPEPQLRIQVADDGAGAEPTLIDRAFERTEVNDPQGGLVLVRAVIEQHGGSFDIESRPGEGTSAEIRLPVGQPQPA